MPLIRKEHYKLIRYNFYCLTVLLVFPQQLCSISPEVGGNAEDHDQHWVVDVEAVGDEREHAHGAHDLPVREGGSRRVSRA